MKTGIFYISNHGTTAKVAKQIGEKVHHPVDLIDIKKIMNPSPEQYDLIILGSSIHAGSNQKGMKSFIKKNKDILLNKKLALFMCCMYEGEERINQFNISYPEELRAHSEANLLAGGEFILDKMNFFEKAIVKKVAGVNESKSNIDEEAIIDFIATLEKIK